MSDDLITWEMCFVAMGTTGSTTGGFIRGVPDVPKELGLSQTNRHLKSIGLSGADLPIN